MMPSNDNEEVIEANNKAARSIIEEPDTVDLEELISGIGKVITINEDA